MELPYHTPWEQVAILPEKQLIQSLHQVLLLYSKEIEEILKSFGFSNIRHTSGKTQNGPQFLAKHQGHSACICMPPLAEHMLEINHLSQEQCTYCDSQHPECDIYYACLFISSNAENQSLELLGPMIVKKDGTWLHKDLTNSQYLPITMRDGMDRYSSIFNGAALFKLYQVIIRNASRIGDLPGFCVKNLFNVVTQEDAEYKAFRIFDVPTLMHIVAQNPEDQTIHYLRSMFANCEGATSELELLSMPSDTSETVDGLVELMEEEGHIILAESIEAALFREKMLTGCRYIWFLSMIAERIAPMQQEFSFTSGPLYEMQRQEYREKHGCEPPSDFAVRLSTSKLRSFMQEKDDTYATVIGQVISVEDSLVDCQPMRVINIHPIVDNDNVQLQVFVSNEVMGEISLNVGDTITASGYVYACADELLVDAPTWQDSPELGTKLQSQDNFITAQGVYEQFSRYSMGHAVAAAAFVESGWEIASCDMNQIYTRNNPLIAKSPNGTKTIICVDTMVDGNPITPAYSDISELAERIQRIYGSDTICYHCTVRLNYNVAAERYAVSMTLNPESSDVKNTLQYAACPFPENILSLSTDKPAEHKSLRPKHLDEYKIVKLFRNAWAYGSWAEVGEWISEKCDFVSAQHPENHHYGKLAFLRYLSERIEMWKQGTTQAQWKDVSFSYGTVKYKGIRRPCAAMYHFGFPTGLTIFDDDNGLAGHIQNIPHDCYSTYIQAEPPISQSIADGEAPFTINHYNLPRHDIPPVAATTTQDTTNPQDVEQRVLSFLQQLGYTSVFCEVNSTKVPQLWFRDDEDRLCWAILYSSDMSISEAQASFARTDTRILSQLRRYPGYVMPCLKIQKQIEQQMTFPEFEAPAQLEWAPADWPR